MTIETPSKSASTENRLAARQWVDAFNARDDEREADARTADYIGHAPDSMHLPALDSDAWVAFLGTFLEGFPDLDRSRRARSACCGRCQLGSTSSGCSSPPAAGTHTDPGSTGPPTRSFRARWRRRATRR